MVADATPELDREDVYMPVLNAISLVLMFKAASAGLVTNARLQTLINVCGGDTALAAKHAGNVQGAGALLEFSIGPFMGKLSDVYGRKFVMQLVPLVQSFSYLMLLLRPQSLWVHYLRIPAIALDTAFFAGMRAMMSDVMTGRNIAENGFVHMQLAGVGFVMAPLLAPRFSRMNNFRIASFLTFVSYFVVLRMRETLSKSQRTPVSSVNFSSCNPFAFWRLFASGRGLRTLSLVSGVQTVTDPRLIEETAVLVMREKFALDDRGVQRQLFRMVAGLTAGTVVGKVTVKNLGRLGHTHFQHFFKLAGLLAWGSVTTDNGLLLTQFILLFGQRQRDGVETLMTELGVKQGMGKGQMEAYKMNWRSVSNIVSPLLMARIFAWGKAHNAIHAPLFVAAGFSLIAEMIFLTLRVEDLTSVLGVSKIE